MRRTSGNDSTLTSRFIAKAIGQSIAILSTIQPAKVLPLKVLKTPATAGASVVIAIVLLSFFTPQLAWTQFQRFAFPASDTLPFSGVEIKLEKLKHTLRYGDDVKLIATVSRNATERLELVTILKDRSEKVLPILPRGESKWHALLTDVKESSQLYARSGSIRSDTGEIEIQLTSPQSHKWK